MTDQPKRDEPPMRDADERLADWIDGRMTERERERFVAELRVNPHLKADLEAYERTVSVVRRALQAPTRPVSLADRVMAAVAQPQAAPVVHGGSRFARRSLWLGLAGAAALLLGALWLDDWSSTTSTRSLVVTNDAGPEAARAPLHDLVAGGAVAEEGAVEGGVTKDSATRDSGGSRGEPRQDVLVVTGSEKPGSGAPGSVESEVGKPPGEHGDRFHLGSRAQAPAGQVPAPGTPTPAEPRPATKPEPDPVAADDKKAGDKSGETWGDLSSVGSRREEAKKLDEALRPAPGAPVVDGDNRDGSRAPVRAPAGPATGGPGSSAPAAPAGRQAPGADKGAGLGKAEIEAQTEAKNKEMQFGSRSGSGAAEGRKQTPDVVPMVLVEGIVVSAGDKSSRGSSSGSRAAPRSEPSDSPRREGDDQRGQEPVRDSVERAADGEATNERSKVLDAAAVQQAIAAFLGSASAATGDAVTVSFSTEHGDLRVSPLLDGRFELGASASERNKSRGAPAPKPVVDRTWLVEGARQDVEVVVAQVARWSREQKATMRSGETTAPAPVAASLAGGVAPDAAATGTAQVTTATPPPTPAKVGKPAEPVRLVLRIQMRAPQ